MDIEKVKLFKTDWANNNINPLDWKFNETETNELQNPIVEAIQFEGAIPSDMFKQYQCAICNAYITWAYSFNKIHSQDELLAGVECAQVIYEGVNAIQYQRNKHIKYLKEKFNKLAQEKDFQKEYPILYQGAQYFKKYNYVIDDIYGKVKYGLTEKQIAYLTKLILQEWEKQVAEYKEKFSPKPPAPKLSVGVQTLNVTISNYYWQEKKYYGIEKAVFEAEDGQTIFTGKTKQLIQNLYVDIDIYEDVDDAEVFWAQDKKERKSQLTHNKAYYDKKSKGLLTVDITSEFADDKYSGKIVDFVLQ